MDVLHFTAHSSFRNEYRRVPLENPGTSRVKNKIETWLWKNSFCRIWYEILINRYKIYACLFILDCLKNTDNRYISNISVRIEWIHNLLGKIICWKIWAEALLLKNYTGCLVRGYWKWGPFLSKMIDVYEVLFFSAQLKYVICSYHWTPNNYKMIFIWNTI